MTSRDYAVALFWGLSMGVVVLAVLMIVMDGQP